MSTSITPADILDAMRVPSHPSWNVFQIGCTSSPLNFASQQMRAFKFAWALDQTNGIRGKEIAVVGAGLAGLTCGLACLIRGAKKIALYDRNHEIMALQHGATHRFVHPMIFRWPDENAETPRTGFPILNWPAKSADKIRERVLKKAERHLEKCYRVRKKSRRSRLFQYRLGTDVRQVIPFGDRVQLLAEGQESTFVRARNQYLPVGEIRNYQRKYDVVVAAAGYGLEVEFPGVPFRSYWQLDTLSQPTIRGTWPRRWLVMGTGDGGLIDAIRLRLFDSDQELMTKVLTGDTAIPGFVPPLDWHRLIGILRADLHRVDPEIRKEFQYECLTAAQQRAPDLKNKIALALQRRFIQLNSDPRHETTFKTLKAFLEGHERTDTVVYLTGQWEQPYELTASLIQRFVIYLLIRHCGLRYRRGRTRLIAAPSTNGGAYRFAFDRETVEGERVPIEYLDVDEVVVRHGAESALGAIFGAPTLLATRESTKLKAFEQSLWQEPLDPEWAGLLRRPIKPE